MASIAAFAAGAIVGVVDVAGDAAVAGSVVVAAPKAAPSVVSGVVLAGIDSSVIVAEEASADVASVELAVWSKRGATWPRMSRKCGEAVNCPALFRISAAASARCCFV
jgi:hypothetical protein